MIKLDHVPQQPFMRNSDYVFQRGLKLSVELPLLRSPKSSYKKVSDNAEIGMQKLNSSKSPSLNESGSDSDCDDNSDGKSCPLLCTSLTHTNCITR